GSAVAAVVGACHPGGLRRGVVVPVREERVFYVHALHDTVRGEGEGVAGTIDDVDDLGLVAVAAARQGVIAFRAREGMFLREHDGVAGAVDDADDLGVLAAVNDHAGRTIGDVKVPGYDFAAAFGHRGVIGVAVDVVVAIVRELGVAGDRIRGRQFGMLVVRHDGTAGRGVLRGPGQRQVLGSADVDGKGVLHKADF